MYIYAHTHNSIVFCPINRHSFLPTRTFSGRMASILLSSPVARKYNKEREMRKSKKGGRKAELGGREGERKAVRGSVKRLY